MPSTDPAVFHTTVIRHFQLCNDSGVLRGCELSPRQSVSVLLYVCWLKENLFHMYNNTLTTEQWGRATNKLAYSSTAQINDVTNINFIDETNVLCLFTAR